MVFIVIAITVRCAGVPSAVIAICRTGHNTHPGTGSVPPAGGGANRKPNGRHVERAPPGGGGVNAGVVSGNRSAAPRIDQRS